MTPLISMVLFLVAVAVGALLAFQPGANAELGSRLGHPLLGAVVNFIIGLSFLTLLAVVFRAPKPDLKHAAAGPWWAWTGGFMGAAIVTTSLLLTRQMGVAAMLAAIVTGQLIASLVVDHFGLVGQPTLKITPARFVGVLLVIVGTFVIQYERATTPVVSGRSPAPSSETGEATDGPGPAPAQDDPRQPTPPSGQSP